MSDVHELLFDTSNDEIQFLTNDSSSSDSDSDFDLSDAEAKQLLAEMTPQDDGNDPSCDKGDERSELEESSEVEHSSVDTLPDIARVYTSIYTEIETTLHTRTYTNAF